MELNGDIILDEINTLQQSLQVTGIVLGIACVLMLIAIIYLLYALLKMKKRLKIYEESIKPKPKLKEPTTTPSQKTNVHSRIKVVRIRTASEPDILASDKILLDKKDRTRKMTTVF